MTTSSRRLALHLVDVVERWARHGTERATAEHDQRNARSDSAHRSSKRRWSRRGRPRRRAAVVVEIDSAYESQEERAVHDRPARARCAASAAGCAHAFNQSWWRRAEVAVDREEERHHGGNQERRSTRPRGTWAPNDHRDDAVISAPVPLERRGAASAPRGAEPVAHHAGLRERERDEHPHRVERDQRVGVAPEDDEQRERRGARG